MPFDLVALREAAGLSQSQLAARLDIDQSKVSRLEKAPERVPAGLLLQWLATLGADLPTVVAQSVARDAAAIDPGTPYVQLTEQVSAMRQSLDELPPIPTADSDAPRPEALSDLLETLVRKPRLVLMGHFDSGKSRLANALLGVDALPCSYQPATRVPMYVRHINDRPWFIEEEVWMMKPGFDPGRWDEPEYCREMKLVAGTIETTAHYGSKQGRKNQVAVSAALVFLDAPILQACELVDLPGSDDTDDNTNQLASSLRSMDVALYLSKTKGLLGGTDLSRLGEVIRRLPQMDGAEDPLDCLFVVATHADPSIQSEDLTRILDGASDRAFSVLEAALEERYEAVDSEPSRTVFRERVFPFWFEMESRRERLQAALLQLLSETLPERWHNRARSAVEAFTRQSDEYYRKRIAEVRETAGSLLEARAAVNEHRAQEQSRHARILKAKQDARNASRRYTSECRRAAAATIDTLLEQKQLEKLVSEFKTEKEAKEYAVVKVVQQVQTAVPQVCSAPIRQYVAAIDRFLECYPATIGNIAFDARRGFAAQLDSSQTNGALEAWLRASGQEFADLGLSVTTESSWSKVSLQASIVGTMLFAASGMFVAAGIAVAIGLLSWFVGSNWQARFAKRLRKDLLAGGVKRDVDQRLLEFWQTTQEAFTGACDGLERDYRARLVKFEAELEAEGAEQRLVGLIEPLQARRAAYTSLQLTD